MQEGRQLQIFELRLSENCIFIKYEKHQIIIRFHNTLNQKSYKSSGHLIGRSKVPELVTNCSTSILDLAG